MLRQTMSIFAYQEHTTTTWMVYLQKSFHDEPATRFLIKFVRAKTISGPKNPIMAAYGPDPKNPYIFLLRVPMG